VEPGHPLTNLEFGLDVEDMMNRQDSKLLQRQMSHIQPPSRWDNGVLTIALIGVFIAGLTAGGLLFAFQGQSASTTADDGRTALAFLMNGTGNPSGR
jgi:hypothetical protein